MPQVRSKTRKKSQRQRDIRDEGIKVAVKKQEDALKREKLKELQHEFGNSNLRDNNTVKVIKEKENYNLGTTTQRFFFNFYCGWFALVTILGTTTR